MSDTFTNSPRYVVNPSQTQTYGPNARPIVVTRYVLRDRLTDSPIRTFSARKDALTLAARLNATQE